ncbi:esterase/lipase [Terriglobus roseus DSM 18391]|uniref:Esterase/lipase n=1 Tax=Terriglobus roseus (strain DSM 18391 / NRRL B-41598 / KBS 63) TaxID=926566 RepID=I3ZFB9_TERRK|nr:alpha/beta hydrolase [Terriglobus roseus]AFL87937.1 esterase/lipase [Terriglobus roseus DSM 18391]
MKTSKVLASVCAGMLLAVGASAQTPAPTAAAAAAQAAAGKFTPSFPPPPGMTIIAPPDGHAWTPLWPAGAPGALGTEEADVPAVSVFLPRVNPTKTVVVVAPGGGYTHLALGHEGYEVGEWLSQHGVAAVVLRYRLGPKYHHPIELGDSQRAVRYARAHAAEWGVDPVHVGMWGFSAGGHLTATAGTHFDAGNAAATDAVDRVSSRPDFLILAYPVISFDPAVMHAGSRKYLLGDKESDPTLIALLSDELQVTPQTPPTFLFSTSDDATVPVANSILFYSALVKAKVPAELHIYKHGAHGAGLALANPELRSWSELLFQWMKSNGWAQ